MMFCRSWRNAAERMYTRLRSRHLVQAFASKHSLRRDLSTAMIYNPKDRSIPLPSLRRGGRRHRVSISARRLRASCGRITELLEGAVAARAVQAEALRRIRGGLPQQDENPITEPRPKRPRGSGKPRRGAHRPDRLHVMRNTSGSRRVTFASQLVHYPPDKPLQYTTYAQAGAVGGCASRNDGVSAGIETSGAAALTSLGGDWSGQSGDELVARGRAHSVETRSPLGAVCPGGDSNSATPRTWGGWMGSCVGK